MDEYIITITTETLPSCRIIQMWSAISVFIEDFTGSEVLLYAQRCLEKKALELGANGIIGFRLTSSSTYNKGYGTTPEVFAYGTPVLWEKTDQDCIITSNNPWYDD